MKNFKQKIIFLISLFFFTGGCLAGYKHLSVAFFDYSDGLGKNSFKSLRKSEYEDACWSKGFVEIKGIETAYINNIPKILLPEQLTAALENKREARKNFSSALRIAKINGAYAFVVIGDHAYIYGISNQNEDISKSKPILIKGLKKYISLKIMSKALCEASQAMD